MADDVRVGRTGWTFLTNHAHVLVCIVRDPGIRLRDVAERVGITERATQGIVSDLVEAGYVSRSRVGRRNHYAVCDDLPLRHPLEQDQAVGDLLQVVSPPPSPRRARRRA
jgi:MarR family